MEGVSGEAEIKQEETLRPIIFTQMTTTFSGIEHRLSNQVLHKTVSKQLLCLWCIFEFKELNFIHGISNEIIRKHSLLTLP